MTAPLLRTKDLIAPPRHDHLAATVRTGQAAVTVAVASVVSVVSVAWSENGLVSPCAGRAPLAEAVHERLGRHGDVGVLDRARDRVPVQAAIEPHADPAPMTDVRRDEVELRLRLDEPALEPVRRRAPEREAAVAVVVVEVHHERALAADEERGRAVAQPLLRLGEREAVLADPGQRALGWIVHGATVCERCV